MVDINYFEEEIELTKKFFNLDDILLFQMEHEVQIIREADWQFACYIDKKCIYSALTFMGSLVFGIIQYKILIKNETKQI